MRCRHLEVPGASLPRPLNVGRYDAVRRLREPQRQWGTACVAIGGQGWAKWLIVRSSSEGGLSVHGLEALAVGIGPQTDAVKRDGLKAQRPRPAILR